jgi:pimeloyl-ACP methyl ester carboxylesterase
MGGTSGPANAASIKEGTEGTVRVPGATLYYRLRGTGPLLLVLQGGAGDAEGADALVPHLIDRFTVLTYDRRGLSGSTIDDPAAPITIETHGDDAHHLLAALAAEPAFVAGISLGALIGLDLAARYPAQVRTLVAHEAPTVELLPAAERARAAGAQGEVEATHRAAGAAAAMRRFVEVTGVDFADREPDADLARPTGERAAQYGANVAFVLAHDAPAARRYHLDIDALLERGVVVVPAAGSSDRDFWIHHCARALADRLGTALVEFPGGHNGPIFHPRGCAARLREILGSPDLPDSPGRAGAA